MYDSLANRVVSEMFGSDGDDTYGGSVDTSEGLALRGFRPTLSRAKRSAAAQRRIDPREIDARTMDHRAGYGALNSASLFAEESYGEDEFDEGPVSSGHLF